MSRKQKQKRTRQQRPTTRREVMLYRAGFLGDILVTNAAVRAIRRRWKSHNIVYQCWPQFVSALIADPNVNQVVPVTQYDYGGERFLDFRHESFEDEWDKTYWGELLYRQALEAGLAGPPDSTFRPHVYFREQDIATKDEGTKLCLLHGWSANGRNWRLWPYERWGELAGLLAADDWTVAQVGVPNDPLMDNVMDLRGATKDIMGLYGLFAVADLCVCIDSAMQHIAGSDKFVRFPDGKTEKISGPTPCVLLNGPMNSKCIVAEDSKTVVVSDYGQCGNGGPCNHSFGTAELPICEWQNACMVDISVEGVCGAFGAL